MAFIASFVFGLQVINTTKSIKAQNHLISLKVNFSDIDTDKNKDISDIEITAFVTEAFKTQGDGSLSPWSYEATITRIKNQTKRKSSEVIFRKIDTNNDDIITAEEYVSYYAASINAMAKKLKERQGRMKQTSKPMPLKPIQFKQATQNDAEQ